jgi:hypothetical protein
LIAAAQLNFAYSSYRRQTKEQAADFALKSLEKHKFRCSGDPHPLPPAYAKSREGYLGAYPDTVRQAGI